MQRGLDWYKRDPSAYLGGVQGLTAKEHAVYAVVLDLIYAHGGSINNDPRWIAGWISDMGSAAVRKAISSLCKRGKLTLEDDRITQKRAKTEAKTKENQRETAQKNGRKGGKKSAEIRATSRENNDLGEARAKTETQADKIRVREDSSVTNVTDENSSNEDPIKVMFDTGISILTAAGVQDRQARAMIGKWRKDFGDDAVMLALARCSRENASDPLPFIQGCLRFEKRRPPQHGDVKVKNGERFVYRATDGWVREYV